MSKKPKKSHCFQECNVCAGTGADPNGDACPRAHFFADGKVLRQQGEGFIVVDEADLTEPAPPELEAPTTTERKAPRLRRLLGEPMKLSPKAQARADLHAEGAPDRRKYHRVAQ